MSITINLVPIIALVFKYFLNILNYIMHSIFLTEIITSQLKKKITTTLDPDIQKILNHFFFLFIFPRPGGWIWTKEAGAKLEVVNCEDGDENPAKDTGPETDDIENGAV